MVEAGHRQMLEAMGIDIYELRTHEAALVVASSQAACAPRLAVVCAHGVRSQARLAKLFAQLPQALGLTADEFGWHEADNAGVLAEPPVVPGYLVLGALMARALGAQLSTQQQKRALIELTAEPAH